MAARGGVLGPVVFIGHVRAEAVVSHGPCSFPGLFALVWGEYTVAHVDTRTDLDFVWVLSSFGQHQAQTQSSTKRYDQLAVIDVCCAMLCAMTVM